MKGLYQQMIEHAAENPPKSKVTLKDIQEAAEKCFNRPQTYSGSTICNKATWKSDKKEFMVTCNLKGCETCDNWNESLSKTNTHGK